MDGNMGSFGRSDSLGSLGDLTVSPRWTSPLTSLGVVVTSPVARASPEPFHALFHGTDISRYAIQCAILQLDHWHKPNRHQ